MEVRALTSPTGMVKYMTGVTSLRDKRNKSRQHLHPTAAYFSFRWSIQHLSLPCNWNGCFVQTSLSVLKPHSQGEVGTEDCCFQMATCLHAPEVQHLTLPKGREAKKNPSFVLTEVKERFALMLFKYSHFSGSRKWTMEQSNEWKASNELRWVKGK